MSGRLDKRVAEGFLLTRSDARAAVRRGRVSVDGVCFTDPSAKVADSAQVRLDGRTPDFEQYIYLMLNKPAGYLSATEDSRDPTVMALLPPALHRVGLGVCGRLDKDSEGLLLLMNDGELNHRLTAPRYQVEKLYTVQLDVPAEQADVARFAGGIDLGDFVTAPAGLEIDAGDATRCRVRLREGKFHQIKRMFAACGKQVTYLKRLAMGGLCLDEGLETGAFRQLTQAEEARLRAEVGILTKKMS